MNLKSKSSELRWHLKVPRSFSTSPWVGRLSECNEFCTFASRFFATQSLLRRKWMADFPQLLHERRRLVGEVPAAGEHVDFAGVHGASAVVLRRVRLVPGRGV